MSCSSHILKSSLLCICIMASLFASSCVAPSGNYKPSGLPGLLAFSSDRDNLVHIYTAKPDGTDILLLSTDNQSLDGLPMWTPDGTRILFTSDRSDDNEIWSMKADGSDRKQLSTRKEWDGLARMSPDGSKIVFCGAHRTNMNIFIMNASGTDIKQLTGTDPAVLATKSASEQEKKEWNSTPTWSPDGSKILFATSREMVGVSPVLYTMNPDGSAQQRFGLIFAVDGTEPDWSPVTNKLVYVRGSSAKGEIWVTDGWSLFPGLTAKKLTNNIDNNHSPVWSPDGKQVAFVSDTYGDDDIFIMDADGANVRRFTYDKSTERHPTWR